MKTVSVSSINGSFSELAAVLSPLAKRLYDIIFSALGLALLSPALVLIAVLVKLSSRGEAFYRQQRVGLHGRPFLIWKFRTMRPLADRGGPLITCDGDERITGIGRILRKTKLDELPQLWNVLKGEMSLVGPRPEVPRYVEHYSPEQRQILNSKPGITDPASLHFRNEELLLKRSSDVEEFYIRHCIPRKVQLNLEYAGKANLITDTWLILQTICPYWLSMITVYSMLLGLSFWLSCQIIYDFSLPVSLPEELLGPMLAFVTVQLGALIWRKQYKGLMSYFSLPELRQVATALGFACLLLLGLWASLHRSWPPRNLIFLNGLVAFLVLSGFRLLLRVWRESAGSEESEQPESLVRVGIIGAGRAGSRLVRQLMIGKDLRRVVVAFFDDDCQKWQRRIHEIPVVGMPECLQDGWSGKLDEVILAMPGAAPGRVRQIRQLLERLGLRVYSAPSAQSLWPSNGEN